MFSYSTVVIFLVCLLVNKVVSEITVLRNVQTLYDKSPKLRIRGSGFGADEHSLILEIGQQGMPSLKADKDFLITIDDDGLILKLLTNRK